MEHAHQQPGNHGTYDRDRNQRRGKGIPDIACSAKTGAKNDLGDLQKHDHAHESADHHAHVHNMRLRKIQTKKPSSAKDQQDRQKDRYSQSDVLTDAAVLLRLLLFSCAERLARQGDPRRLHSIGKGESKTQQIHAHIMRGKLIGSQTGCQKRGSKKSDPHREVFRTHVGTKPDNILKSVLDGHDLFPKNQRNADITVFQEQRPYAHDKSDHGSQHGSQCRAGHAQCRKTKMSSDQQVIEQDVHAAGYQIRRHGDPGVPAASLGRVDQHRDDIEERTAHDDSEVNNRAVVGVRVAPRDPHQRRRPDQKKHRDQNTENRADSQSRDQHLIGRPSLLFSLPPGNDRRYSHVDGKKQRQRDKLRLLRQAHRRYCVTAHRGHHHRVDHAGQRDKEALKHCRPRHLQRLDQHIFSGPFHVKPFPVRKAF